VKIKIGLLIVGLLLSVVIGPVFGPGTKTVDSRLPNKSPEACIDTPTKSVDAESASVSGKVTRTGRNITITYSIEHSETEGSNLQVDLPHGAELLSSVGFDKSDFANGLYWKNGSKSHSITYKMREMSVNDHTSKYPSGEKWILAGAPDHFNGNVDLHPKQEGYIGGNILYLGEYSTHHAEVGCQEFVAVVPKQARLTGVNDRLSELKTAAKSLPVGHKYKTIRIFAHP
jgi:hypothetical protein